MQPILSKLVYMQGIPFFDYKILQQNIEQLIQESGSNASAEQLEQLQKYKEEVSATYNKYQENIKEVSSHTKKFQRIKLEVRKLMMLHRKKIKQLAKKTFRSVHNSVNVHILLLTITQF